VRRWAISGLAVLLVGAVAVDAFRDPSKGGATPAPCGATRVEGEAVRAGPFKGLIVPKYDVVGGRFRLRVGQYRDRSTGLTQKIPWLVRGTAHAGPRLRITGERLDAPHRGFSLALRRVTGSDGRKVYPSIIAPPAEGCWRLHFRSGATTASLIVLVRG
jgi:hypothetical protein